jgi:membrane protease YdiL (CAAX protease family)
VLLGLSLAFYLAGALVGDLTSGEGLALPLSVTMFVCPALAALLLAHAEGRPGAARALVSRLVELPPRGRRRWLVPAALVVPAATAASYTLQHLLGRDLPDVALPLALLTGLVAVFLVTAAVEEVGWTGYLLDLARARWGPVRCGLLIGAAWALWHAVPYAQAGHGAGWITAQCLVTVALRVLIVWVYERSGRALSSAVVLHASINVSVWALPALGSHYDPVLLLPVLAGLALGVAHRLARTSAAPAVRSRSSLPPGLLTPAPVAPPSRRRAQLATTEPRRQPDRHPEEKP